MKLPPSIALLLLAGLAACKSPPTDADIAARNISELPIGPSEPIDSPPYEGAIWGESRTAGRIIYGIAGEPPQMAIACITDTGAPQIRITRYAAADAGALGFLALIGNGHVARIPIDAVEIETGWIWQADIAVSDPALEVLTGQRQVTATVPGAGMVTINPSMRPSQLIESCRELAAPEPEPETIEPAPPAL